MVSFAETLEISPESLGKSTPPEYEFEYISLGDVENGQIDWSSVEHTTFQDAPSRARRIPRPGDALLGTVRPYLRPHAYADWDNDRDVVCSTGFAVLRPKEGTHPGFIRYVVLSEPLNREIMARATGSNYPAINQNEVAKLPLLRPPLSEQRRIAHVLDTADAVIRRTEAVIDKLEQMKQGLLQDLLTRGLNEGGRLRPPQSVAQSEYVDSPRGAIPHSWTVTTVGSVFELELGKMLNQEAREGPDQRPYLANRHVQWGEIVLDDLETMHFSAQERAQYRLEPGDILVCEGGEIGRTAIWSGELAECYFQKAIHRLKPRDEIVEPHFFLAVMRRADREDWFSSHTHQTSIAHLTQTMLSDLEIPIPPIDEQRRIANALHTMWSRIETEQRSARKLIKVKRGLMQDLLTGRVRVPGSIQGGQLRHDRARRGRMGDG